MWTTPIDLLTSHATAGVADTEVTATGASMFM